MSFQEVTKAPTTSELNNLKRNYRIACKKFDDKKYQFLDALQWDDWEVLTSGDFLELKELYLTKKRLYWEIHQLENPNDKATKEAYDFLNKMNHNDQFDFLTKTGLNTLGLIDKIRENPNFLNEVEA